MDMENFHEQLTESLEEETNDAKKYIDMAAMAQQLFPHCGYDAILRDIANEEIRHHKHLQSIIADIKAHE